MAITYTPTTNFGAKDSLPTNDPDKVIKGSEFTTEFTAIQTAFSLAAPNASPTFTGTVTIPTADINGGAIDGTTIGGTTPAAGSFTTVSATGNITVGGTVDGRDVAADGTKLDGIEAGADVTDTTNVTAAGALMDSELTNIAAVKALNQGVATTDSPSFAGLTATTADINGGTIDGATIGGASAAAGTFTTLNATGGGALTGTWTDLGSVTTVDINGGTIDGVTIGGSSAGAITGTTGQFNTSLNVDGTVTADGLKIENSTAVILTLEETGVGTFYEVVDGGNYSLRPGSLTTTAFRVASNGDISFYEDTGTTPKFFWDASAESLGIGTTSPERLLHINSAAVQIGALIESTSILSARLALANADTTSSSKVGIGAIADDLALYAGGLQAVTVDDSGNVGIGTTSPGAKLTSTGVTGTTLIQALGADSDGFADVEIKSTGTSGASRLYFSDTAAQSGLIRYGHGTNSMEFTTSGSERMRIDSSGNVGIGTSSPNAKMVVAGTDPGVLGLAYVYSTDSAAQNKGGQLTFGGSYTGTTTTYFAGVAGRKESATSGNYDGYLQFLTRNAPSDLREVMRIDSSGNLLVGTTSSSSSTAGIKLTAAGTATFVRDGVQPVYVNRLTSDGDLAVFAKDGTTVGSIGSHLGAYLYIASASNVSGIGFYNNSVRPVDSNGSSSDADQDLGASTIRWKNLYLSGGVYLGGTGAANKLDDYEEGTFTPSFIDTNGDASFTHDLQGGKYTKVGDVVHFVIVLGTDAVTAGTGSLRISGLPFTSVNNNQQVASGAIGVVYEFTTAPSNYLVANNVTEVQLYSAVNPLVESTSADMKTSTNDNRLYISGSYFTA